MSNISFAAYFSLSGVKENDGEFLCAVRKAGFNFCVCALPLSTNPEMLSGQLLGAGLRIIAIELDCGEALANLEKAKELAARLGVPDILLCVGDEPPGKECLEKFGTQLRPLIKTTSADTLQRIMRDPSHAETAFVLDTFSLGKVGNPADTIRALPDRCPLLLLQDADKETASPCAIGEGALNWTEIFDACEEAAVEWYLCPVEDSPTGLELAQRSLAYLNVNA